MRRRVVLQLVSLAVARCAVDRSGEMRQAALLWHAHSASTLLATKQVAAELVPNPKFKAGYPGAIKPGEAPPIGKISMASYMSPSGRKWVRVNQSAIAAEAHQYHVTNTNKDPGPPYDPVTDAHAKEWIDLPTLILKGERHTGTNLLQAVVTTNLGYDGQVLDLDATYRFCFSPQDVRLGVNCCWKHGFVDDRCTPAYKSAKPAFLLLVRSVYPWLLAMHREPYEYNGALFPEPYNQSQQNFSEFLRSPAKYERVWLADHPSNAYRTTSKYDGVYLVEPYEHDNPIVMWRNKMRSYLDLNASKVLLTHDDLYDQHRLSAKLNGLTPAGFHYKKEAYNESTQLFAYPPMADSDGAGDKYTRAFTRKKFEDSKADSDANKRWLASFSQEDLDFVNSYLTEELMQSLDLHMVRSVSEAPGVAPPVKVNLKAVALAAVPASGAPVALAAVPASRAPVAIAAVPAPGAPVTLAATASGAPARASSRASRDSVGVGLGRHPSLERGLGGVPGFGLFRGSFTSPAVGW